MVRLRRMTLVVIIGIICSFSIRTFGTLFPQVFRNALVAKGVLSIHTLYILAHLLFWIIFCAEYASARSVALTKACVPAILGSAAVALLYIKNLSLVFGMDLAFPRFLMTPQYDAFAPLLSSAFHLSLFVVFLNSLERGEEHALRKPIVSIIAGIAIYLCLHMVVIFNYFTMKRFEWLEHMPRGVAVGTVPLIVAAVILMIIFYVRFYSFLDSNGAAKARDRSSVAAGGCAR